MILVTGAGGWLGSELTKRLLEDGNTVRAFNNIETDNLKILKQKYLDKLDIIIGDICDYELVKKSLVGVDEVFHLAAKVHFIPTNKQEEDEFYKINTQASKNIFEQCLKRKIKKIIFFSTVSVYGESNEKISIKSLKYPSTVYGKTKLQAEKIAIDLFEQQNLPIIIIEPVTVYGEGDVGNFKKLEKLISKRICIQFGRGTNKKTIIYYKDLISMAINLLKDDSKIGKTIICGTEIIELKEINRILKSKSNKRVLNINIPEWIANLMIKICCISFLKKIRRRIIALMQNNEFEFENKLVSYTKFIEYELENKGELR